MLGAQAGDVLRTGGSFMDKTTMLFSEKLLGALEWPRIATMLSELCATPYGIEVIRRGLFLDTKEQSIDKMQRLVSLADGQKHGKAPHLSNLVECSAAILRWSKGGEGNPEDFGALVVVLEEIGKLKRAFTADYWKETPWRGFSKQFVGHDELAKELRSALSFDDGIIRDSYSKQLRDLRKEEASARKELSQQAEHLARHYYDQGLLQDSFVTMRNNRFVLPMKAEKRHVVEGIVHDYSSSGATVYVEPHTLAPIANRLQMARSSIAELIKEILAALSQKVSRSAHAIAADIEQLAYCDAMHAQAKLMSHWQGCIPELEPGKGIQLKSFAHPLLRATQAVRNTLELNQDERVLVVSGPNAGGKTVLLKAVGLLSLLCRAGIPIPAGSGSNVPFFERMFVDIGDEQSLERDLSTFSSHMQNLKLILDGAGPNTLVLLDEIAASTDPVEGAVLAKAILLEMHRRGATVVVSTHLAELKDLSVASPGFQAASFAFDEQTLAPTYRLRVGQPGRSHALDIARMLGLPDSVLAEAQGFLAPERRSIEDVLRELHEKDERLQEQLYKSQELEAALDKTRSHYVRKLEALEERKIAARTEEQQRIVRDMQALRDEAKKLAKVVLLEGGNTGAVTSLNQRLKALEEQVKKTPAAPVRQGDEAKTLVLHIGDVVQAVNFNAPATVLTLPDAGGTFQAALGSLKMKLQLAEVVAVLQSAASKAKASGIKQSKAGIARSDKSPGELLALPPHSDHTLDVRGRDAEDALSSLDRFLDEEALSGTEYVYLIHGHGTEVLKKRCREYLAKSRYVADFRPAAREHGGDGATIVLLADG